MRFDATRKGCFLMLLVFSGFLAGATILSGQSTDKTATRYTRAEREVLKVNEDFDRAIVARDVAAYDRIFADEFIFTSFDGRVSDKTQELEKVKSGSLRFEYGKSDDVRVKVYGKTAVVTGRFTAAGQSDGKDFSFVERYTAIFFKRGGRWQMVAEHATEIKPK